MNGLVLTQSFQLPRFGDIKTYCGLGRKKPRTVALVAPHTPEHPAVLLFQRALAKKLMEEGIQIETHEIRDMMQRGWRVTKRNIEGDPQIITKVLTLEDFLIRTRVLKELSQRSEFCLEIHAHSCLSDASHADAENWRRIEGTRILVSASIIRSLAIPQDREDMQIFQSDEATTLARKFGFDIADALQELKITLRELKRMSAVFALIEIPSRKVPLTERHPMHSHYYTPDGSLKWHVSGFEEDYCANHYRSIRFSKKDVQAVASILMI